MILVTTLWGLMSLVPLGRASDGDCPVYSVEPAGKAIAVDLDGARLPRASLVRAGCGVICNDPEQIPVQVLSVNHWYQEPDRPLVPVQTLGCLSAEVLSKAEGKRLLIMDAPPGADPPDVLAPGTVTDPMGPPGPCSASTVQLGDAAVPTHALRHARTVTSEQLDMLGRVQSAYAALFGPIGLHRIGVSDWGYVGLPMVHERTDAEIQGAWARERLVTDEQRQRAVVAEGPSGEGGVPVYLHFLGSDARFSDRWARPETVVSLLKLSKIWFERCAERVGTEGNPGGLAACTLQIGDLAWYNDQRPDPLGHRHHYEGTCVDVRLFRSDASRYEAYWNRGDDREGRWDGYWPMLNGLFLHTAVRKAKVGPVYFNDPDLHVKFPSVEPRSGHDDHIHMCFVRP